MYFLAVLESLDSVHFAYEFIFFSALVLSLEFSNFSFSAHFQNNKLRHIGHVVLPHIYTYISKTIQQMLLRFHLSKIQIMCINLISNLWEINVLSEFCIKMLVHVFVKCNGHYLKIARFFLKFN